jgi:serine/threonine protein kinase/tetratricopeptide (TPR) repeat protein
MIEESLFHRVCAQPAEERAGFLIKACGADHALRQRVERLLNAHEHPGTFMAGPPAQLLAAPPMVEAPGTVIGPFTLLEPIGEGGMGVVFLAEQHEPIQRRVALKVIKPGMDTRPVIARFEAERQTLALMDHPNIARVLDAGASRMGRPYFVMELCQGVPITEYCDQHNLDSEERLHLFITVCKAVQHAHLKGIIHRDLKPSNVLLARDDGAGDAPLVKVIDFGIAKALGEPLTDRTLLSAVARPLGTPLYMSPEQAAMAGDIDTRSDIYSLGVLLYELLTGATPFDRQRLNTADFDEVRRIIREEEPPPPSTRLSTLGQAATTVSARRQTDPRRLQLLLRGELDWIVLKALEKDRNRRYETASAFAADVERYLRDEPVLACPPSAWYRARKFARRNEIGLLTLTAVLLAGLLAAGGIGWALWDGAAQQEARRTDIAVRLAETERTVSVALAKADQLAEQAQTMPNATSAQAAAVLVVWQQAVDTQAQAVAALNAGAADDDLRQRVTAVRDQLERGRRQTERAWARAAQQEKLLRNLDEARMARSVWVDSHFDHAAAVVKYAAAFAEYDLAVTPNRTDELARRLGAEEPDVRDALIVALDDWADAASRAQTRWSAKYLRALAEAADHDPWRKRYRAAVASGDGAALRDLSAEARRSSLPPSSLLLLAQSLDWRGERDEGLALLRWGRGRHPTDFWLHAELGSRLGVQTGATPLEVEEAIGCFRAALALRPAATAVHTNLGAALHSKNLVADAIEEYRQAIKLDPKLAQAYDGLGLALQSKNQLEVAIANYRQAIKLDPRYASPHNNLGKALQSINRVAEAITEFHQAIKLDPNFALAHNNLGAALWANRQLAEAIAEFRQAIKLDSKYASPHNNLGAALLANRQLAEAIAEFRQAIKLNPGHADAHVNLGTALSAKHELAEAIAEFRQAIQIDPRHADAHHNLALALQSKNQLEEAIAEFRQAIKFDPKHAKAHVGLGGALMRTGRFADAKTLTQQAVELFPENNPVRQIALRRLEQLARLLALEAKLPDVLARRIPPADSGERLGLIEVCNLQRRTVAGARLYADAFAADAKLADDLKASHRYNAACFAALAAAGQGTDADKLDGQERMRLRLQALAWLRSDLDLWSKRWESSQPAERQAMRQTLQHWVRDTDLAGVRDAHALQKLSVEAQAVCRTLWADVAELLKKAGDSQ